MKGEDSVYIQQNPDSLRSGDLLRAFGKLDEAASVYLRCLKKWRANLDQAPGRVEWKQNLSDTVDRITMTIRQLFDRGNFNSALECADNATAIASAELSLQATRACALMMSGRRNDEARSLFLRYRGEIMEGKPWEAIIGEQFAMMR